MEDSVNILIYDIAGAEKIYCYQVSDTHIEELFSLPIPIGLVLKSNNSNQNYRLLEPESGDLSGIVNLKRCLPSQ